MSTPNALPASQLARLRTDLEQGLPGTVIISTPGTVSDGHGGWVDSYTPAGTVSAALMPMGEQEARYAEQLRGQRGYTLVMPWNTSISERQRVTHSGTTYEVVSVEDYAEWAVHRRATVIRTG